MHDTTAAPNAVDVLVTPDSIGGWAHTFTVRGREFTMADPAGASFYEGRARFPVWGPTGRRTSVTVREADAVTVLSRSLAGNIYPEEAATA